jgi:Uma2 family endonuclease
MVANPLPPSERPGPVLVTEPNEGLTRRGLKVSEYEQLAASGAFEGEKVELLFGEILPRSPQGTLHSFLAGHLARRLGLVLDGRASVRAHSPIRGAADSMPEPDVAVLPLSEDVPERLPEKALLLIEVAESSRRKDLGPKARLYALSGYPHYWVFDLEQRLIRVHADPRDGEYRLLSTVVPGVGATLSLPDFPDVLIEVDPLFARLFPEV